MNIEERELAAPFRCRTSVDDFRPVTFRWPVLNRSSLAAFESSIEGRRCWPIPRHDQYPCSGWPRSARIVSASSAVSRPTVLARPISTAVVVARTSTFSRAWPGRAGRDRMRAPRERAHMACRHADTLARSFAGVATEREDPKTRAFLGRGDGIFPGMSGLSRDAEAFFSIPLDGHHSVELHAPLASSEAFEYSSPHEVSLPWPAATLS